MTVPLNSAVPTGTWRVRAFTDPKGSSVGETTFMVEDYVPDRIEFDLSSKEKQIKAEVPVELKVDGRFLYGAPASGLQLEGDMLVAPAGRPGFPATSSASPTRRPPATSAPRSRTCPRPTPTASSDLPGQRWPSRRPRPVRRKRRSSSAWRRPAAARSSASWCCRWRRGGDDRRQAAVRRQERRRRRQGRIRRRVRRARRQAAGARRPALRAAEDRVPLSVVSPERPGNTSRSSRPSASPTAISRVAADKPARVSLPPQPGRYRLDVKSTEPTGR
jgi:hypothetical protein